MALGVTVISTKETSVQCTLTDIVPGTVQSISYADIAAAYLAAGGSATSTLYRALTAPYASGAAALDAMYGRLFENYFTPLPTSFPTLQLGASAVQISSPPGSIASNDFVISAYSAAKLVEAGAQTARFYFESWVADTPFTFTVSSLALLLGRTTPIKSALAQIGACSTTAELLAALRETQLTVPYAPGLTSVYIYPAPSSANPFEVYDSSGTTRVIGAYDEIYESTDFAFTVPHSIIK
jgi:hypothetical protein